MWHVRDGTANNLDLFLELRKEAALDQRIGCLDVGHNAAIIFTDVRTQAQATRT